MRHRRLPENSREIQRLDEWDQQIREKRRTVVVVDMEMIICFTKDETKEKKKDHRA